MLGLSGRPTKCTIKGHCHTHIFRFPNVFLKARTDINPLLIAEQEQSRATIVSDLQSYFEKHSPFHYSINHLLRSEVEEVMKKESQKNGFSLFVVIEREIPCETTMDDATCFIVDKKHEGDPPGGIIMMTGETSGVTWSEEEYNINQFVNMILAAIKIEQNTKDHIEKVSSTSCFFDIDERAIYFIPEPQINIGLCVDSPLDDKKLKEKTDRLQKLISGLEADMQKDMRTTSRLITALRLEKTKDDNYRRIWYLRLYEAMLDKLTSRPKKDFDNRHKKHQVKISHPDVSGKINMEHFNYLQTDVLEELRRIYLKSDGTR